MSTYVIDVDNTICISEPGCDYSKCPPIHTVIEQINYLYDQGNKIILFTARGMRTFDGDVELITTLHKPILEAWLNTNGVRYHELIFGKPWGEDVHYVDDKNLSIEDFLRKK
jgi:capsule biosynthesis phosphatase